MCLDTLDSKETTAKLGKEGKGWKVFFPRFNEIFDGVCYGGSYKKGEEYESEEEEIEVILYEGSRRYKSGFHLFELREDAETYASLLMENYRYCVLPVKWRGLLASGTQAGIKVIVAKYMTILEE